MIRMVKGTQLFLREHPFLRGLESGFLDCIADCAALQTLAPGTRVFAKGQVAESCYLIRQGRVSLELPVENGESVVVETLEDGEVMGWAWLSPPHRATLDARVLVPTTVIHLNGTCLRRCIDADDQLGFVLYKRFKPIIARHMAASRRQVYQGVRACSG